MLEALGDAKFLLHILEWYGLNISHWKSENTIISLAFSSASFHWEIRISYIDINWEKWNPNQKGWTVKIESRNKEEAELSYSLGGLGSGLVIKLLIKRPSSGLIGVSLFLLCTCLDVDTWEWMVECLGVSLNNSQSPVLVFPHMCTTWERVAMTEIRDTVFPGKSGFV